MNYLSDIEIAQSCKMRPITEIAKEVGIGEEFIEQYGKYKAKTSLDFLKKESNKKCQQVILDNLPKMRLQVSIEEH